MASAIASATRTARSLSRGSTRRRVTRGGRELRRARRSCSPRKQASGLVRPSLFARSCLRPTAASMPTPSPLVVRESGHGAAATRSGVDEQYASRHSAWLHCPARDCRRSCRVVRGFAVRAAAASARAWRRLPARHRAPSMQWRALPRPARLSIPAWSPDSGANQGALFRLTGNRPWPHVAPWNTPTVPILRQPEPENRANAANSWIPASGRSRTRTWDLFLIRKTFCPLQSPQLALNPCKPPRRRQPKGTGEDWRGQAGGPIVAPRPRFEGRVSYEPEAVIMPTIRSSPDAAEAGRCAPA